MNRVHFYKLICLKASEATIATDDAILNDLVFLFIGIVSLF